MVLTPLLQLWEHNLTFLICASLTGMNGVIIEKLELHNSLFNVVNWVRVLGPFKNEGNEMAQAVLNIHGNVIPRRTVNRLSDEEMRSPTELAKRIDFDEAIRLKLGNSLSLPVEPPSCEDFDEADLL